MINLFNNTTCCAATAFVRSVTILPRSLSWTDKQTNNWNLSSFPSLWQVVSIFVMSLVYILKYEIQYFKFPFPISWINTLSSKKNWYNIRIAFYRRNWFALDRVALLAIVPCAGFRGESSNMLDKPPPDPMVAENFLADRGDSNVLNICPRLWTGEFIGEFLALFPTIDEGDEDKRCWRDWLKSIVTFRKKSQTERFFPNNLADLYLEEKMFYVFNSILHPFNQLWIY